MVASKFNSLFREYLLKMRVIYIAIKIPSEMCEISNEIKLIA